MNSSFWQVNIGQLIVSVGMFGSAVLFVWRTAALHGQHVEQMRSLNAKVDEHEETSKEHGEAIDKLSRLADVSEKRLELIEQELRDRRNRVKGEL